MKGNNPNFSRIAAASMRPGGASSKQYGWSLALALALAGTCFVSGQAAIEGPVASGPTAAPQGPQPRHRSRPDERVSALAKALGLDATQQAQLTKVLSWQREQVRGVWNDPAVPPDFRVTAVHAISDQTAEQIRGLLNEEQKGKYKLPRQPHPVAEGEGQRSVADWLDAMKPR
jgi:hypothetical protein